MYNFLVIWQIIDCNIPATKGSFNLPNFLTRFMNSIGILWRSKDFTTELRGLIK